MTKTICLALTGASGMPYGLRLLGLPARCRLQGATATIRRQPGRRPAGNGSRPAVPPEQGQGRPARPLPHADADKLAVYGQRGVPFARSPPASRPRRTR